MAQDTEKLQIANRVKFMEAYFSEEYGNYPKGYEWNIHNVNTNGTIDVMDDRGNSIFNLAYDSVILVRR